MKLIFTEHGYLENQINAINRYDIITLSGRNLKVKF